MQGTAFSARSGQGIMALSGANSSGTTTGRGGFQKFTPCLKHEWKPETRPWSFLVLISVPRKRKPRP